MKQIFYADFPSLAYNTVVHETFLSNVKQESKIAVMISFIENIILINVCVVAEA